MVEMLPPSKMPVFFTLFLFIYYYIYIVHYFPSISSCTQYTHIYIYIYLIGNLTLIPWERLRLIYIFNEDMIISYPHYKSTFLFPWDTLITNYERLNNIISILKFICLVTHGLLTVAFFYYLCLLFNTGENLQRSEYLQLYVAVKFSPPFLPFYLKFFTIIQKYLTR